MGVRKTSKEIIRDTYYCPNNIKSVKEVEMNKVGSYSLRIRRKQRNNKKIIELNVKVITQYGDHNTWKEYEVSISSFKEGEAIIKSIGFKPFLKVNKERETFFLKNGITLCIEKIKSLGIEKIKSLGNVIETEIITSRNKTSQSKKKILSLFRKLGIDDNQIIPKSAANLLMKKKAIF